MRKELTIHGETLGVSQKGMLEVEQFLKDNYLFRFNELSGKVEYVTLPSDEVETFNPIQDYLSHLPQWDGQNHVARLFGRLPGVSTEQLEFLSVWIRSAVAYWFLDVLQGNPTQGCIRGWVSGGELGYVLG
jgi:hypothetical protein